MRRRKSRACVLERALHPFLTSCVRRERSCRCRRFLPRLPPVHSNFTFLAHRSLACRTLLSPRFSLSLSPAHAPPHAGNDNKQVEPLFGQADLGGQRHGARERRRAACTPVKDYLHPWRALPLPPPSSVLSRAEPPHSFLQVTQDIYDDSRAQNSLLDGTVRCLALPPAH